jgi:hypothetical protein
MLRETDSININPVDQITVKTITAYKIGTIEVNLYKGASINVQLFNEQKNIIKIQILDMTEEEYSLWGTDDSYVNTFVCSKLGFTPV